VTRRRRRPDAEAGRERDKQDLHPRRRGGGPLDDTVTVFDEVGQLLMRTLVELGLVAAAANATH
jgi:hypothetical protein